MIGAVVGGQLSGPGTGRLVEAVKHGQGRQAPGQSRGVGQPQHLPLRLIDREREAFAYRVSHLHGGGG